VSNPFTKSLAGLPRPTTGFYSHNASNTGSRPLCGGAYLAWRPPIYAIFTALSLLVQQAAIKCSLLSKAIWLSRLFSLRQCGAVPFQLLVQQPGTGFPQIRGTSQTVPVLSTPAFEDYSFPLGLVRERF